MDWTGKRVQVLYAVFKLKNTGVRKLKSAQNSCWKIIYLTSIISVAVTSSDYKKLTSLLRRGLNRSGVWRRLSLPRGTGKRLPPAVTILLFLLGYPVDTQRNPAGTPRQNVYACAGLSISGHFFQSKSPALFCVQLVVCCSASCYSCFWLFCSYWPNCFYASNQAQITDTISRLDSEKVSW